MSNGNWEDEDDTWADGDSGDFHQDDWEAPSTDCCQEMREKCLACGHDEDCPRTTCCHSFQKVERGWEEFLEHDDDYCDCRRCSCRTSDFAKCEECWHVKDCEVSDQSSCKNPFHFNCWCPDEATYGDRCLDCQHRKYCFEPDCDTSSHCDCRVESPSAEFCESCDHTLTCEVPDCEEKSHLEAPGLIPAPFGLPVTITPDSTLVEALERFEELRDAKNAAAREYESLRKELLEGPLKGVANVIDPIGNGSIWIEIVTKDRVHIPQSSLSAMATEFPEAYAKYARSTSSKYVLFANARRFAWWLRGKNPG